MASFQLRYDNGVYGRGPKSKHIQRRVIKTPRLIGAEKDSCGAIGSGVNLKRAQMHSAEEEI
jgi:hypothetical protein